jgi:folate-binding protein YgfZ
VFLDLSSRTKLRVAGKDRLRFLNGQLTNNVARATSSTAIAACVLNAKGKMEAHVFASPAADAFLIDADPELREKLWQRLERYVIADDVQIEDITPQFSIFHVLGSSLPELGKDCRVVAANRFRQPATDVWMEAAGHDALFEQLAAAFQFCDNAKAEVLRIEEGIPRWGRELTEEIIPVEANLEGSSIDYEKGCYIGQEVISRMKISGQRNKKLAGFVSTNDAPLEAGMKLFPIGDEKKEAGWITSTTRSKRLAKEIALGYIKRPFPPTHYKLDAVDADGPSSSAVRVEIVDLPFAGEANQK